MFEGRTRGESKAPNRESRLLAFDEVDGWWDGNLGINEMSKMRQFVTSMLPMTIVMFGNLFSSSDVIVKQ